VLVLTVLVWAILVGFPLVALLAMATYAYVDAPRYGMEPRKWAAISFFVPFFGFFAYLFERDELTRNRREEMFVDGPFEIHESRADDAPFAAGEDMEHAEQADDENGGAS